MSETQFGSPDFLPLKEWKNSLTKLVLCLCRICIITEMLIYCSNSNYKHCSVCSMSFGLFFLTVEVFFKYPVSPPCWANESSAVCHCCPHL